MGWWWARLCGTVSRVQDLNPGAVAANSKGWWFKSTWSNYPTGQAIQVKLLVVKRPLNSVPDTILPWSLNTNVLTYPSLESIQFSFVLSFRLCHFTFLIDIIHPIKIFVSITVMSFNPVKLMHRCIHSQLARIQINTIVDSVILNFLSSMDYECHIIESFLTISFEDEYLLICFIESTSISSIEKHNAVTFSFEWSFG